MADEADKTEETKKSAKDDKEQAAKRSGLGKYVKYIVFGVAGLVAVLAIAFGTLMFLDGDSASKTATDEQTEAAEHHEGIAKEHGEEGTHGSDEQAEGSLNEDSILSFLDQDESVLEAIMSNLEVLDYVPGEEELAAEQVGMSVEDSIEAVNWLDSEKARLVEREKELDTREKQLNVLDSKVSQKILRSEQADSARISKLAKLYDGMEARSVAKLVANLDDETVVALLPRMKLKNASEVLSLMPPARAARLSKQMITIAEN